MPRSTRSARSHRPADGAAREPRHREPQHRAQQDREPLHRRRWARWAAPAVLGATALGLAGASFAPTGDAEAAETAVPDHLVQAALADFRTDAAQGWFSEREVRAAADERIAEQRRLEEEARAAEAARLAEEARRAAEAEATRNAQRDPKGVARVMVADRGWSAEQFSCLESLWTKESDWRWDADNPTSSAYGIPQSLPGSKMAAAGPDWETNPVTQITWGLEYIANRYGTPCSAWSHSQAVNWY
ncbi:lytic transglycosylase domain-containing protein [Kineococcus terrestris]|uniref:aggregation-promoting factor C-terminal-like domain-containing protein n=1 Tax=Kineococcus terrestris TaxID=2044856 RepID=UPI0034DB0E6C